MRVLITGMSGTGKSSALFELARRGYAVVDTDDDGWTVKGLWDERRMLSLLSTQTLEPLFVSGCVENQGGFYPMFDAIVLFSAPKEVMLERIVSRTSNDFGKTADEREKILSDLELVEPLLRATATLEIDTQIPLSEVVERVLAIARLET
ncbi:ATP-binding protein [bacterium]|nr:MAG: ATP-binding protein [bacterium]